jgi:hypothetical protein
MNNVENELVREFPDYQDEIHHRLFIRFNLQEIANDYLYHRNRLNRNNKSCVSTNIAREYHVEFEALQSESL